MRPASLEELRRSLREAAEPERVETLQRFFKTGPGGYGEGDVFLGVRVPAVRAIAGRFDALDTEDVLELLSSRFHEERLAALVILVRRYRRGDAGTRDFVYDLYLDNTTHVNGWDLVDASAPQILGAHLLGGGAERLTLDRLARSPSVWERRIAIMATFAFVRAGEYDETLRLARDLLDDEHDLIHKASGWMLREVGKREEALLTGFLERHAQAMPRTMLRYAIERLDAPLRARFLAAKGRRAHTPGASTPVRNRRSPPPAS
ncbi:MAG: DNA alkylation repair protein [Rubrobacter sp.]